MQAESTSAKSNRRMKRSLLTAERMWYVKCVMESDRERGQVRWPQENQWKEGCLEEISQEYFLLRWIIHLLRSPTLHFNPSPQGDQFLAGPTWRQPPVTGTKTFQPIPTRHRVCYENHRSIHWEFSCWQFHLSFPQINSIKEIHVCRRQQQKH